MDVTTTRSEMRSKTAIVISIVFFFAYGWLSTVGVMLFLGPSFGSRSWVTKLLAFVTSFPVSPLKVESLLFLLLVNSLFWTAIVYFLVLLVEKLVKRGT